MRQDDFELLCETFGSDRTASRCEVLEEAMRGLAWFPQEGFGYYEAQPTETHYFELYSKLDNEPRTKALMMARSAFVRQFYDGQLLDFGIGSGSFITADGNCLGYDIEGEAVAWLLIKGLYSNPFQNSATAICFFDSLEHLRNPLPALACATQFAFVSIPIFRDAEHVLLSKHFKPAEHFWYFTEGGLVAFMRKAGWLLVGRSLSEKQNGREDVMLFAFKRL